MVWLGSAGNLDALHAAFTEEQQRAGSPRGKGDDGLAVGQFLLADRRARRVAPEQRAAHAAHDETPRAEVQRRRQRLFGAGLDRRPGCGRRPATGRGGRAARRRAATRPAAAAGRRTTLRTATAAAATSRPCRRTGRGGPPRPPGTACRRRRRRSGSGGSRPRRARVRGVQVSPPSRGRQQPAVRADGQARAASANQTSSRGFSCSGASWTRSHVSAAVAGADDDLVVAHGPAEARVVHEDARQQRPGGHVGLAPGLALVARDEHVPALADRHHDAVARRHVEQQRRGRQRRLDRRLPRPAPACPAGPAGARHSGIATRRPRQRPCRASAVITARLRGAARRP